MLKISGVSEFKRVVWFRKIDADDLVLVGKKAYDLNALYSSGFEVPPSFVVTTRAYKDFIKGFEGRLDHYLSRIDINHKQKVREVATKIQKLILSSYMPQLLEQEILDAYDSMNVDVGYSRTLKAFDFLKSGDKGVVAVRTSPVAKEPISVKDMEFISFLNIQGVVQLLRAIKACWASLFSTDNIMYREKNNLSHKDISAAVIIQKMVKSEKSGIMLTSNPNGNDKEAIIDICWGLGKTLKEVTPDCYFVDKKQNVVLNEETNRQAWGYFGGVQGRIEKQDLPDRLLRAAKLEPAEIIKLSNIAKTIEEKYDDPYEVEFTFDKEKMWIIGMKPMHAKKIEKVPESMLIKEKEEGTDPELEEEAKQMEEVLNNIFKSPPITKPVKREETKVIESIVPDKPETHPQVTVTQTVEEQEEKEPEEKLDTQTEQVQEPVEEKEQESEGDYIEIPIPKEEPVEEKEQETIVEQMTEPELSYDQQQRLIEEIKQKYSPVEEEPEIEYEVATEPELVMPNAAVVAKSKQDIISKLKEIHAPMEETNPQPEKKVEEESRNEEPMQQAEAEQIEEPQQEQREETAEEQETTPNEQVMEEVQKEEPIEQSATPDENMMADVPEEPAPEPTTEPQQEEVPEELPKPEFREEQEEPQPAPEPMPGPVEDVAEEHREEPAPEPTPEPEQQSEPEEEVAEEPQEQPAEEGMTEFESRLNLITERYIQTYPHMRSVFNEYKERVKGLYKELH